GSFLTVSACSRLTGKVSFGSKSPVRKPIGEGRLLAHSGRSACRHRTIPARHTQSARTPITGAYSHQEPAWRGSPRLAGRDPGASNPGQKAPHGEEDGIRASGQPSRDVQNAPG